MRRRVDLIVPIPSITIPLVRPIRLKQGNVRRVRLEEERGRGDLVAGVRVRARLPVPHGVSVLHLVQHEIAVALPLQEAVGVGAVVARRVAVPEHVGRVVGAHEVAIGLQDKRRRVKHDEGCACRVPALGGAAREHVGWNGACAESETEEEEENSVDRRHGCFQSQK